MKEILLTQNKVTIVDDEDYESLSKYKWFFDHGYAKRNIKKYIDKKSSIRIYMHTEILGKREGFEIDHINRKGLDNRKSNLRYVTSSQNSQNQTIQKGTSSKYKGVSWFKRTKKWMSYIKLKRKKYHLGYYTNEQEAALAYNLKALELFGEYANLNIINL